MNIPISFLIRNTVCENTKETCVVALVTKPSCQRSPPAPPDCCFQYSLSLHYLLLAKVACSVYNKGNRVPASDCWHIHIKHFFFPPPLLLSFLSHTQKKELALLPSPRPHPHPSLPFLNDGSNFTETLELGYHSTVHSP